MSAKPGFIKCYDAMSNAYKEVRVSKDVEQFIKRSYWKEDMQNRRYYKRKVSIEDSVEYMIYQCDVWEEVSLKLELEHLRSVCQFLSKRDKHIIHYVYELGMSYSDAARRLGISSSYMSRLVKKLHERLRQRMSGEIGSEEK